MNISLFHGPGSLPVHVQIRNHLACAIGFGEFPAGTCLPSVRELAATLKVAPNTVARAYQELQENGLLVAKPGQGTFVKELVNDGAAQSATYGTLGRILQPAIASARATGYSPEQIRQMVEDLLADRKITVGLIATNERILDKWTAIIMDEFGDLGLEVVSLILEDLQRDFPGALASLERAHHVFSLITTYAEVRSIFHPRGIKVSVLLTELSQDTQQALSNLPADGTIGLVCSEVYASSMLGTLGSYVDTERLRWVASHDRDGICVLGKEAGMIVHTFDARPNVLAAVAPATPCLELDFVPEGDCFSQLREMLQRDR
jgi:DNA-binding transcriptional regulator YhcF (GntR family)